MSALSSVRGLGSSSSSRYYDNQSSSRAIRLTPRNSGQGSSGSSSESHHSQPANLHLQPRNPLIAQASLSNYSRDHSVPWYKSPEQIQLILVKNLFIVINLAIVGSSIYVLSMSGDDFWRPDHALVILGLIFGIILCVIGIFGGLKDEDYLILTYSLVALVTFILLTIYETKKLLEEILMGLYVILCFYFSYLLHRKQKVVEIEKQIPLVHAVIAASKNSLKFTSPAIATQQMIAATETSTAARRNTASLFAPSRSLNIPGLVWIICTMTATSAAKLLLLVITINWFFSGFQVDVVRASCKNKKSCKKQIVAVKTTKTIPVPYPVPVMVTKYKTKYKPGKPQVIIASMQKRKGCGCSSCCPIPIPIPVPAPAAVMPSETIEYADYYQTVDEDGNPVDPSGGLLDYYGTTVTDYYDYGRKKKRKR